MTAPSRRRIFLGVDPGVHGGLVAIYEGDAAADADLTIDLQPLEKLDLYEIWRWIERFKHGPKQYVYAIMEKVGGYLPGREGMSHGGQPGSHMFTFGKTVGMLEAFLVAANIPYLLVIPRTWQASFGLQREKGSTDSKWKNVLKDKAKELYPSLKVTLATSDALLMAEYCRRSRS